MYLKLAVDEWAPAEIFVGRGGGCMLQRMGQAPQKTHKDKKSSLRGEKIRSN